ncbi:MAG: hypothetical protein KAI24_11330 [Planctomycetes bacterium]|nr:hypothetical protein [Planctomycetota bacterium]
MLEVLDQWRAGRPEDAEPHVRTARYLLTLDRTAAALAALADAVAIAPQDPRLFELRVAISARHYEGTSQSGPSLFAQCVDHRKSRPDVEDPIGFVLCAQAAQSQPGGRAAIVAISSARAAIGAFPQANLPRQIELQALLAAARHDEAAKAADLAVRALQPDAITLGLAIQAKRAAGQSIREIVRIAMPKVPRTPSLQAELLRIALEDAPATSAQFVHEFLTAADAPLDWCVLAIRALVHQGETDRARQLLANAPAPADAEQRSALLTAFASWVEAQAAATADAELAPMAAGLRDRLALGEGAQQPLLAIAPRLADTHPATALELLERALPAALPHERTGALYALAGDLAAGQGDLVRAASRWLAALGFEDGVHVAEKLTRLLLLQEQEARAAKVYELVGRPTDPALAARMGRLPQAATLVAAQLQADPADLLVHATLATFGQFALVDWQAPTDPEVQNRRLELLSGLRDPALAELTLARADAMLRGDPSKQTHYLLLARATADAGLSAAASALHAQLFRAGLMNPVLLREVAYAGQRDDYVPDPKLDLKLMDAVSKGGTAGSQLTLAYGTARIVRGFEAGGFPDMARTTRLTQWLAAPQLQPWTDDDLELITTGHEPPQACYVLDRILAGPHAGDRDRLLRAFYRLAPRAIEASADSAGPLLVMAANHLQVDGARGEIVHFLLDQKSGEVPVDERAMLLAHVELVARGRDDGRLLDATVARLTAAIGVPRTAAAIDELLARYPTSLPMWALRTRLQSRLRNADVALGEMRSVLGHARDDRAELSFFALAAAERNLTDADVARLAELPKELRESPLGRYVQGLFALRLGDAATALSHFAAAAPQHDGRHLFFAALAELEVADGPSAPRAVELLTQLRRDYPSSSFARNVGSFVRQLSPR